MIGGCVEDTHGVRQTSLDIDGSGMRPGQTADILAAVADVLAAAGPGGRLRVLTEGPQTISFIEVPE